MREQKHNIEVIELENGFKLTPREEERGEVIATLNPSGFWKIKLEGASEEILEAANKEGRYYDKSCNQSFPFYNFYNIMNECVSLLYLTWEIDRDRELREAIEKETEKCEKKSKTFFPNYSEEYYKLYKKSGQSAHIRNWAFVTTRKTLSKVVRGIWKEKEKLLDPNILTSHRKLFAEARGKGNNWNSIEKIFINAEENYYLIQDIINYKACRVVMLYGNPNNTDFYKNWISFYQGSDSKYMRKTLTDMPGGLPSWFISSLFYHTWKPELNAILPEPVKTTIRLLAYCTVMMYKADDWKFIFPILNRSSDEDIRKAVRYIWKYYPDEKGRDNDFRRVNHVSNTLNFIYDGIHQVIGRNVNIVTLAKESRKYHLELENESRLARELRIEKQKERQRELLPVKVALPPIPLPVSENIKLLNTYGEILDESSRMLHCIDTYAKGAIRGNHYLFHIDYQGEEASAQVTPEGNVVQVRGVKNKNNTACDFAKKELSNWGKALNKNKKEPILRIENNQRKLLAF